MRLTTREYRFDSPSTSRPAPDRCAAWKEHPMLKLPPHDHLDRL